MSKNIAAYIESANGDARSVDETHPLPTDTRDQPNPDAPHEGPLTVGSAAALLTSLCTLHADTQKVLISVETTALRFTVNGTTPTSTLGINLSAGTAVQLSRAEAAACLLIRATGSDSAIQVAQYL